jgi:hypothetical protein
VSGLAVIFNGDDRECEGLFSGGAVTIIDLTDPFINSAAACALFDISLTLYLEKNIRGGKLLVLDEAHKVSASLISSIDQSS